MGKGDSVLISRSRDYERNKGSSSFGNGNSSGAGPTMVGPCSLTLRFHS